MCYVLHTILLLCYPPTSFFGLLRPFFIFFCIFVDLPPPSVEFLKKLINNCRFLLAQSYCAMAQMFTLHVCRVTCTHARTCTPRRFFCAVWTCSALSKHPRQLPYNCWALCSLVCRRNLLFFAENVTFDDLYGSFYLFAVRDNDWCCF